MKIKKINFISGTTLGFLSGVAITLVFVVLMYVFTGYCLMIPPALLNGHASVVLTNDSGDKIRQISMESENSKQIDIFDYDYQDVQFIFPNIGENAVKVTVEFFNGKIITSEEHYLERSYEIRFLIKNDKIDRLY